MFTTNNSSVIVIHSALLTPATILSLLTYAIFLTSSWITQSL
jgi:hypothetical protein